MSYAKHRRKASQVAALRPVRAGEHPPLPLRPVPPAEVQAQALGKAPGEVVRIASRYHVAVPAMRRLDASGRVLWDAVSSVLSWVPGLALEARLGPGSWVTFFATERSCCPRERRLAHLDTAGRLVIPHGVRTYLGIETGEEVVLRIDAESKTLQVAGASLVAQALELLERVEASAAT
ncbi:MAG: hypothetical protein M0010_21925 [Actinomycetota bacterium]|nr:hypothetical protein [Actinomycetota bacterium]